LKKKDKSKGFIFKNVVKSTKYPLIDVDNPELYRDVFPYNEICKIKFDHKIELIDPPEEIYLQGRATVKTAFYDRTNRNPL
jgi:hypothetical protein